MEDLTKAQNDIGKAIEQHYSNFKKDSASRKTAEYIDKRLSGLDAYWTTFQQNHNKILGYKDTHSDHLYFVNSYFEDVKAFYTKYRNQLLDYKSKMLSEQQATSSPAKPLDNEYSQAIRQQQALIQTILILLEDIDSNINIPQSQQYYEFKIKLLTKYEDQLSVSNQKIWASNIEGKAHDDKLYHDIDVKIQNTIITLEQKLAMLKGSLSTRIDNNHISEHTSLQVKLPKISIPTFDGNYFKWLQFKDLFEQLVHQQPISGAEKMFYLINNITGDARALVKHLPVSNENYESAWNTLNQRYHNKRLLVNAFLNKLLSMPVCQIESAHNVKLLHDVTKECILALENLGICIINWDPIIVHILIKKFDRNTHVLYEQSLAEPRELDSIKNVLNFLEARFQALEALGNKERGKTIQKPPGIQRSSAAFVTTTSNQCVLCKRNHALFACKEFLMKTPINRHQVLKAHKLCFNCLKEGHSATTCTLRGCNKCNDKHNTLVHCDDNHSNSSPSAQRIPKDKDVSTHNKQIKVVTRPNEATTLSAQSSIISQKNYVLLSTVIVKINTKDNNQIECRAILDCGSQLNFITERMAKKLGLPTVTDSVCIQGVGQLSQRTHRKVNLQIQSRTNNYSVKMDAFILPQITTYQPTASLNISSWPIPANINLADPQFQNPGPIDLLLGADNYYEFLSIGQIKLGKELPTLQNTVFGWVVAGKTGNSVAQQHATCGICNEETSALEEQVQKFWKLEEVDSEVPKLTPNEQRCETFFKQTTKRDNAGRFIVKLPFAQEPTNLGESKDSAMSRFLSLEKKLDRNPVLKREYSDFMQEYIRLGHMTEIKLENIKKPYYFLPHHCVLKPDSVTTKLRVVFDGSAKTTSKLSLNDVLHTGPKIQEDLFSVLLRFRFPRFVFTADIEKMYRQIVIDPEDRKFQLIIWRDNTKYPLDITS